MLGQGTAHVWKSKYNVQEYVLSWYQVLNSAHHACLAGGGGCIEGSLPTKLSLQAQFNSLKDICLVYLREGTHAYQATC